jgi:RNA polymerase sigma-70 factor (ECF subfamily)
LNKEILRGLIPWRIARRCTVSRSEDMNESIPTETAAERGEVNVPSDRSLLARLRGGQQDAATELYLRYAQRLRALVRSRSSSQLARRVEPDDIVQSVFRRFFRRVLQGDYDVPPGEELWGLLLVIAMNKIRTEEAFYRAAKRDVRLCAEAADPAQLPSRQDSDTAILQLCVEDALGQLSPQQRTMVELRIQGHEVAEIARQTGRSKRTIERNLQDVRARFRELLGRCE